MLTWRTVDARTGSTVEEFPGASVKSDIVQVIGRGESVTVEVPWPDRFPADRWRTATTPGRMVLVLEDETRIWWGGLITGREVSESLTLTASAPEQLLARAFVPDLSFTQVAQTKIMRVLGLNWLADNLHGRVEMGTSPVVRDRTYVGEDDKSRLDAMHDLMKVIGGPEFATRWEVRADGTVGLVCLTADRLGFKATADRPATVEIYPDEWSVDEQYGAGQGAPIVRASTTKEGTEGGEQEKVWAERSADDLLAAGWVPLEERFTPETGSVSPDVIGSYADGRLADLRGGTTVLTAKTRIENFPLHDGLHLGDDVIVTLQHPDLPRTGAPNLVRYAPGLSVLVGSVHNLRMSDAGLWTDEFGDPLHIVADARLLGWSLAPEGGEFAHATAVLDLEGVRWW